MIAASIYIALCSARNRMRMRLRRLREPRYLIGAILGAAYLFFVFVLPRRAVRRRGRGRGFPGTEAFGEAGLAFGSVGLMLMAAIAWVLPASSSLFAFTEAEIDLLFPAPVSRRQLLVHRLIRSQLGLLFAAMMPAFLIADGASALERLLRGIGLWVTFATIRVYFAGVSMARAQLGARTASARALAWAPLAATVTVAVIVGVPLVEVVQLAPAMSFPEIIARVNETTMSGLQGLLLWPFRALVRPLLVINNLSSFAAAIGPALLVLTAAIAWVLLSDEVFTDAGTEPLVARAPVGRRRRSAPPKVRAASLALALTGRPEMVFFWKNGMQMFRSLNMTSLLPLAVLGVYAVAGARLGLSTNLAEAVCIAALMLAAAAMLLGPGSVMSDLRGDLRHIEVIKTWPIGGSAVIRGEMLWPGILLTGCTWFLLLCAMLLSDAAFPRLSFDWRLAIVGVAMLMAPALIFAQYLIHQAAAVMFPGWIPSDNDMRGFESMAQRLILFAGVVLALIVVVGPGAIAGGVVAFGLYRLLATPFVFVPCAAISLAIVAIEVILATEALAPVYDRIDLSGVERGE
jgi:putative ABC exporter